MYYCSFIRCTIPPANVRYYPKILPCFSLNCTANAWVKLAKTRHGPHSSTLVVICVVRLLFVLFYVLFLCKCILHYCHRVTTQLQLKHISYQLMYKILFRLSSERSPHGTYGNRSPLDKRHLVRKFRRNRKQVRYIGVNRKNKHGPRGSP